MRIRITRPGRGELEGVRLESFQVGQIYDVGASVATYLVTTGYAEPMYDGSRAAPDGGELQVAFNVDGTKATASDKGPKR